MSKSHIIKSMTSHPILELNGFTFPELFNSAGLKRLDQAFMAQVKTENALLHEKLQAFRNGTSTLSTLETSELLIVSAIELEKFIGKLFNIEEALSISKAKTTSYNPISTFKKYFVLRRAKKELNKAATFPPFKELDAWLQKALDQAPLKAQDKELSIALLATHYLSNPDEFKEEIETLVKWCTQALATPEGSAITRKWVSFKLPERIDHLKLINTIPIANDSYNRVRAPEENLRLRDGFKLTDPRMEAHEVQDEVNYCIYCHDHEGDFCSKGFPVKKGDSSQGFKKNPLDLTLAGCPLEEKISEMHFLKKDGNTIASLAMVMIDNPMCPATGHRICNDCMKACIYQKQDPVNIPQIETRVLTDVLDLPWGVEIYDLLTRWNPLRQRQWIMKPYNGLKIMIAGMGPAGFTLAHHLLLEGFAVVGFDGLKIEPLPETLIKEPIYRYQDLKESLDERLMAGFGGVAEYGITVRWDKNFLKLIYLSLLRKPYFQVFGGIRFGGTITIEDAWEMGFDHFVVAVGAGLPKALPIPGSLAPGMRQANDFLMALQLNNAAKTTSLTNLQIRLPAVVIGGGLTGVDTATELQAYYITQVEKVLKRYEKLAKELGEDAFIQQLDPASREILNEYLQHGRAVRNERERAKAQHEAPNFIKLIHEWGGVTIAYRRAMHESPAYINNHEELKKALEEGIYYLEGLEPVAVQLDNYGHSEALICRKRIHPENSEWKTTEEEIHLRARSILVATGTQPNTAYEFEHRGTFNRLNLQYQHYEDHEGELTITTGVKHCKEPAFGPFTSYQKDDKRVSLIGDTHPVFHGNVVKAIASGMRTYPKILAVLADRLTQSGNHEEYQAFAKKMTYLFHAEVVKLSRETSDIIEITIKAPLAAKHFQPGQFYRLQNFESLAPRTHDTLLQMDPLALVAADCNRATDTLTFIVLETTASAKLCALLKPHEPVSLMGPTGVRAKTPSQHETILIIGGQTSFAFLRSYGPLLRAAGNRVIFASQLTDKSEAYCHNKIEAIANHIIWLTKTDDLVPLHRECDYSLQGEDIISALITCAKDPLNHIPFADIDRVFIIGDSNLLRRYQAARKTLHQNYFLKDPKVLGSVYGNMQCMLKGVCAQCLQWQIDPETGQRTKAVFACSWQDQPLEIIDIDHIDDRLSQNQVMEQLNKLWINYLFQQGHIERI